MSNGWLTRPNIAEGLVFDQDAYTEDLTAALSEIKSISELAWFRESLERLTNIVFGG